MDYSVDVPEGQSGAWSVRDALADRLWVELGIEARL